MDRDSELCVFIGVMIFVVLFFALIARPSETPAEIEQVDEPETTKVEQIEQNKQPESSETEQVDMPVELPSCSKDVSGDCVLNVESKDTEKKTSIKYDVVLKQPRAYYHDSYYINDIPTTAENYNFVEVGKTYNCRMLSHTVCQCQ